jgi:hypothetical protein
MLYGPDGGLCVYFHRSYLFSEKIITAGITTVVVRMVAIVVGLFLTLAGTGQGWHWVGYGTIGY